MAFVTTNDVHLGSDAVISSVKFGAAAIAGNTVYLDIADSNRWKQADSNASEATAGRDGIGVLLHDVDAAEQYGLVATDGTIYIDVSGATLDEAGTYVLGPNAGSLGLDSDVVASGNYKTIIGVAGKNNHNGSGADALHLSIQVSGKQIPP
jgi:predicted heme/steroid binding protein